MAVKRRGWVQVDRRFAYLYQGKASRPWRRGEGILSRLMSNNPVKGGEQAKFDVPQLDAEWFAARYMPRQPPGPPDGGGGGGGEDGDDDGDDGYPPFRVDAEPVNEEPRESPSPSRPNTPEAELQPEDIMGAQEPDEEEEEQEEEEVPRETVADIKARMEERAARHREILEHAKETLNQYVQHANEIDEEKNDDDDPEGWEPFTDDFLDVPAPADVPAPTTTESATNTEPPAEMPRPTIMQRLMRSIGIATADAETQYEDHSVGFPQVPRHRVKEVQHKVTQTEDDFDLVEAEADYDASELPDAPTSHIDEVIATLPPVPTHPVQNPQLMPQDPNEPKSTSAKMAEADRLRRQDIARGKRPMTAEDFRKIREDETEARRKKEKADLKAARRASLAQRQEQQQLPESGTNDAEAGGSTNQPAELGTSKVQQAVQLLEAAIKWQEEQKAKAQARRVAAAAARAEAAKDTVMDKSDSEKDTASEDDSAGSLRDWISDDGDELPDELRAEVEGIKSFMRTGNAGNMTFGANQPLSGVDELNREINGIQAGRINAKLRQTQMKQIEKRRTVSVHLPTPQPTITPEEQARRVRAQRRLKMEEKKRLMTS